MANYLKELNPEQQKAVVHKEGPLLILAGAGSGKTRTLTYRIAYLMQEKGVKPHEILAVTFTNKAATEMRERLLKIMGISEPQRNFMPYLGTFHGICVRLLREEAENIGLSRNFLIFDSNDSLAATKQAMRQLRIDEKRFKPTLIRGLISSAKNELIGVEGYKEIAHGPAQEVAANVYPLYQRILNQAQALDFDDLLFKTVTMLKGHKSIRDKWQKQFKHVMIDEYQDTNHAQYELSRLLLGKFNNICVVGDDWQSIYSWRGADFQNILNFKRDYPDAVVIKLEQNYRSTASILNAAQEVIVKNEVRSEKKLWTNNTQGEPLNVYQAHNEQDEAEFVVRQTEQSGRPYNEIAVLYRTNAQSRSLEEALIRYGIPYKVVGGVRFYDRQEIKDILAYLRLVFQPEDLVSFKRVVNVPRRALGDKSVETFLRWQTELDITIEDALKGVERCDSLNSRSQNNFGKFYRLVNEFRKDSETMKVSDLVEKIVKKINYFKYLEQVAPAPEIAADKIENVQELVTVAKEYDEVGLAAFLEEAALLSDVDQYDQSAEAVTLMTLHAAKGLEFPEVFIVGLEEGIFPHSRSLFNQEELEEERRLMYVGMTRAQEKLHLLHATSRMLFGNVMRNPPARFLSEISTVDSSPAANQAIGEDFGNEEPIIDLQTGDLVSHPVFGEGVVEVLEDEEATVKFNRIGKKRLHLAYAPLKKV
ncbi:MAG: UvrD-helicase domain-containing protein [Candidatus Saccharimonadales bacterium]